MNIEAYPGYDTNRTEVAHPDEKCFGVLEVDLWVLKDDKRVVHRIQIIDFLRGNVRLKEFRDLNELKLHSNLEVAMPLQMLLGLDHSVGEAKEMADEARERGKKRAREMLLQRQGSTLLQDAITQAEIKQKVRKRASHFGSRSAGRTAGTQRN